MTEGNTKERTNRTKVESKKVEAPKAPNKVAIVGFSPSTRDLAPFNDPSFELWGMNSLFQFLPGPWHRWIEMHDQAHWDAIHKEQWPKIEEFFKTCGIPLYMQDTFSEYPTSVKFPLDEINEYFGFTDLKSSLTRGYWESTVAYYIALAIFEERFDEIHLYGIDMTHDTEWAYQRPNTEFFLGLAVGKGIKVHIPAESALLSSLWLYGYEDKPSNPHDQVLEGLGIREQELMQIIGDKNDAHLEALLQKTGYECALQELHHMKSYMQQLKRGRTK
jgi:hypothetical protein